MSKAYIILLRNQYLLFSAQKPTKQGHYTKEVRLFETDENSTCQDICKWVGKKYKHPSIQEVKDWE